VTAGSAKRIDFESTNDDRYQGKVNWRCVFSCQSIHWQKMIRHEVLKAAILLAQLRLSTVEPQTAQSREAPALLADYLDRRSRANNGQRFVPASRQRMRGETLWIIGP
jgi:hypothetical protein